MAYLAAASACVASTPRMTPIAFTSMRPPAFSEIPIEHQEEEFSSAMDEKCSIRYDLLLRVLFPLSGYWYFKGRYKFDPRSQVESLIADEESSNLSPPENSPLSAKNCLIVAMALVLDLIMWFLFIVIGIPLLLIVSVPVILLLWLYLTVNLFTYGACNKALFYCCRETSSFFQELCDDSAQGDYVYDDVDTPFALSATEDIRQYT